MLSSALRHVAPSLLSILTLIVGWELVVRGMELQPWLMPSPSAIWAAFLDNREVVARHALATSTGALLGLAIGALMAVLLAILMVMSGLLRRILMPILLIEQSIPKLALAPILVIWFGTGMTSRVVIALVISFFPIIINTYRGLTAVDPRLGSLMHSLSAPYSSMLLKVRLPNAAPYIFAGLKVAAPLSIVGAVVAEFVQSDSGLGFLILIANGQLDTPLIFASVVVLALVSLLVYGAIAGAEQLLMRRRYRFLMSAQET